MRNPATTRRVVAAALMALSLLAGAGSAAAKMIANPDPNDPSGGIPPSIPNYVFPDDGFRWEAPQRYNRWGYAWAEREETTSWKTETYQPEYVNPSSWPLTVMGCQTESEFVYNVVSEQRWNELQEESPAFYPDPVARYRWDYNGKSSNWTKDCYGNLDFPTEGIYFVTLTVRKDDGTEQKWTKTVEVKDFLVVVLGDSSASGEGAPDIQKHDGIPRAEWTDNRCHRSYDAGGAQAARRIEDADSKSTVTFLSFACSGATLASEIYNGGIPDPYENEKDYEFRGVGVTAPYSGIEPTKYSTTGTTDFSDKVPSQVDQLWNALTNFGTRPPRKIDALIVAGGINDARFADLATICVLFMECPVELVGETNFPPRPGDVQRELDEQFQLDVARVPGGWDALGDALAEPRQVMGQGYATMHADNMLALEYPPFFEDDDGDICDDTFDDVLPFPFNILYPFSGWDYHENVFGNNFWANDLNTNVRIGSERNGFTFVDTIADRFKKHGMCADNRWINSASDSATNQGDADGASGPLASLFSKGTAHPNPKGYSAYADEILRHLGHLMKRDGNSAPAPKSDKVSAGKNMESKFNVLDNDTDADPVDSLAAAISTQPSHGTVTMKKDGSATYKPKAGYLGPDSFFYEVTDGSATRLALVSITVIDPVKVVMPAIAGMTTEIGGLLGAYTLEPPYNVVFDKPLRPERGSMYFEPDDGILYFDPPPLRRGRIRMAYTIYSETPNVTSPSYGESVRGVLTLKVKR